MWPPLAKTSLRGALLAHERQACATCAPGGPLFFMADNRLCDRLRMAQLHPAAGLAPGSTTDQMKVALAPVQIDDRAAVENGILFRTELHFLIIPFRHQRLIA